MTALLQPGAFAVSPQLVEAIQAHAMRDYPNESCGVITADGYTPLRNLANTPSHYFDCNAELAPFLLRDIALALAHSHPDGPSGPSQLDMRQQAAQCIPWGIVMSTPEVASEPFWWGPGVATPPLIGREFRHGPSGSDGRGDCYALIRDYFLLHRGVTLMEMPRDDNWWEASDGRPHLSLYEDHFAEAGFHLADRTTPEIGDVLLLRYPGSVQTANHGGIYMGRGEFLHHLTNRVSRIDQVARFARFVTLWLRHAG